MVTTAPAGDIRAAMALPPAHLLLFWGPLFWISFSFVVIYLYRVNALAQPIRYMLWPLAVTALLFIVWALTGCISCWPWWLDRRAERAWQRAHDRAHSWHPAHPWPQRTDAGSTARARGAWEPAVSFALLAVSASYLLIMGAELFFVHEAQAPARANTVFKLWYQAWILQSAGGAAGLAYLVSGSAAQARAPAAAAHPLVGRDSARLGRRVCLSRLPRASQRANGFSGSPTLYGLG